VVPDVSKETSALIFKALGVPKQFYLSYMELGLKIILHAGGYLEGGGHTALFADRTICLQNPTESNRKHLRPRPKMDFSLICL